MQSLLLTKNALVSQKISESWHVRVCVTQIICGYTNCHATPKPAKYSSKVTESDNVPIFQPNIISHFANVILNFNLYKLNLLTCVH